MARIPKEERNAQIDAIVEASSDSMHVIEMRVENIKRVKLAHIRPKHNTIIIGGKNGHGKSSVLDAFSWGLTGTATVPRYPIRKGQRTGSVKIDIGDFLVTRYFTVVDEEKSEKGLTYITKLVVTGKKGEAFPSPQVLLDRLLGKISFDPMAFMRKEPEEQVEELRSLVKFDVDIDAMEAEQKADYDARREAGRTVDSLKSRIAAMPVPTQGLPAQEIDVEAITLKLQNASEHNSAIAQQKQAKADALKKYNDILDKAAKLRATVREMIAEADTLDGHDTLYSVGDKPKKRGAAYEAQQAYAAIEVGEEIDTAEVAAELTQANHTNAAIQRAANYRQLEKDLKESEKTWAALDKRMKEREAAREAAMTRAKMPIEKLSIANGEAVYDGFPLSQASDAAKIRVSMAIGMAANPKLRVMCIRDGSLLDDDSLQLVDELATANQYQVIIERVGTEGNVSVIMEDGNATGEDVEVQK